MKRKNVFCRRVERKTVGHAYDNVTANVYARPVYVNGDADKKTDGNEHREHMGKILDMQYQNLRANFNDVVKTVLGKDYYNEGSDFYTCDALTCRDLISEFRSVKVEKVVWNVGFWMALALWAITSVFH